MKIKTDFVTNSSSTCYVVMTKGELTLESFIKASGIKDTALFKPMFESLYNSLSKNLEPLETGVLNHRWYKKGTTEDFIKSIFSEETWNRIVEAQKNGFEVFIGDLSSDTNSIETYFCTSAFLIESDNLIVDATNDGW